MKERIEAARRALAEAVDAMEARFAPLSEARAAVHGAAADADNRDALIASRDAALKAFDEAELLVTTRDAELGELERISAARDKAGVLTTDGDHQRTPTPSARERISVTEQLTYRKGGEHSWFQDIGRANGALPAGGGTGFYERLNRNIDEMRVEYEGTPFENIRTAEGGVEKRVNPNTTAGQGGEFAPPLWLMEEFLPLARAGRPFLNALASKQLPSHVQTLNFPRVSTGATVAAQADAGAVSDTDATTGSLSVPIITIAGQQEMSRQLFDRSVPGFDQVILADLAAAYGTQADVQGLNGSGSGANAKGVLNASGINAVTFTSGSPTVPLFYSKVADAIQRIHTLRFLPPDAIFMHPVRWAWILASLDTQNRPLVTPYAPMNSAGDQNGVVSQGPVGSMQGLPVYTDASIPVTSGAGTNQDTVIVCRRADLYLYEDGAPNQNTYFEVLSANLQVRVQVYGYMAFTAERYAKAVSTITGTGLVAPTF